MHLTVHVVAQPQPVVHLAVHVAAEAQQAAAHQRGQSKQSYLQAVDGRMVDDAWTV